MSTVYSVLTDLQWVLFGVAIFLVALGFALLHRFIRRAAGHDTAIDPVTDESFKDHSSRGTYRLHLVTKHTPVSRANCGGWNNEDCLGCDDYGACAANARAN